MRSKREHGDDPQSTVQYPEGSASSTDAKPSPEMLGGGMANKAGKSIQDYNQQQKDTIDKILKGTSN